MIFLLTASLLAGQAAAGGVRASASAEVSASTSAAKSSRDWFHPHWPIPQWRPMPLWTKRKPHFLVRKKERFVSAVGQAEGPNHAAALAAAGAQARARLQEFLKGKLADEGAELDISRARTVDSYTSSRGRVYVRIELEAP